MPETEKKVIVYAVGPVKREAGESPARTRRCKRRVLFGIMDSQYDVLLKGSSLRNYLGRGNRALMLKSEDLPVMRTVDHEDLVSAEV